MTKRAILSEAELADHVKKLPGWTVKAGKLHREYKLKDFVEAFGFMASCALVAEKMDHHPAWSNVYNTVVVDLDTHDAGGITMMDVELALAMERLA